MSRTVILYRQLHFVEGPFCRDGWAHFDISRDRSIHAIEEAMVGDQKIFLITQQDASVEEPGQG